MELDERVIDRMLAKCVETATGCWEFCGATSQGYGVMNLRGRLERCHRIAYGYFRAEIPGGLHIDHLCSNRLCCNPWHLEPVTPRVNLQRAHRSGVACRRGHALTPENSYFRPDGVGGPCCRVCIKIRTRRQSAA